MMILPEVGVPFDAFGLDQDETPHRPSGEFHRSWWWSARVLSAG